MPGLLILLSDPRVHFHIAGASEMSSLTHHSLPGYFSFGRGSPMKSRVAMLSFFGLLFLTSGFADSHNGIVDGYGCHRDPKNGNYHCHQGPYAGKSFPSREEFLRQLRNPKSNLPQPKNTPLPPDQSRPSDMEDRNRP
jgi:hypothetical protein